MRIDKNKVQNDANQWKNDKKNDSFYYGSRKCEVDTGWLWFLSRG
jgi:hypothetical protein